MHRYSAVPLGWVNRGSRSLAISRVQSRWAALNATAASILQACEVEGGRTLADLHQTFQSQFGPVEQSDLQAWLENLADAGLLRHEAHAPAPAEVKRPEYRVEHVYIELLARCNLRCVHCFMGGAPEREEALAPETVFALLDSFAARGGQYVTLSGGEPLLYKRFADVARHAAELNLNGTVISNGTVLRKEQLELLDRNSGFNIAISLDGITPAVNKAIRGRTPAKALDAIDRTLGQIGPDRFILSFTPVKANLDELPRLFDFVESRGIRRLNLSLYESVGRAVDHADLLGLDAGEREQLIRAVYEKATEWVGKVEIDFNDTRNILSRFSENRSSSELHPLWRGVRVTSNGEVFPSSFGAVEQFRLGNIHDTPFEQLLASDVLTTLYADLLDRDTKTPKCRECVWRQICRGGSVASAYCATGEIYSPDAYCDAYLEVFPQVAFKLADLAPAGSA